MFSNRLIVCFGVIVFLCYFMETSHAVATEVNHVQPFQMFGNSTSDNICCLPNVVSIQAIVNQYRSTGGANNNIMKFTKARTSFYSNFNFGKRRVDASYEIDGKTFNMTRWTFKIHDDTAIIYESTDGENCKCYKSHYDNEWKVPCFPRTANSKITKGKVGNYDALNVATTEGGNESQTWMFREPNMSSNKCWILSTTEINPQMVSETQFYNMVEKADASLFKIPAKCLQIEDCLKVNQ